MHLFGLKQYPILIFRIKINKQVIYCILNDIKKKVLFGYEMNTCGDLTNVSNPTIYDYDKKWIDCLYMIESKVINDMIKI